jgi:hypothetical protein
MKLRAIASLVSCLALCASLATAAAAEMVMKILIVNPSQTETKEFDIRNPLPPEVKPSHVINADGLRVEYDSQVGTYLLLGTVTLKPKEAITKRIVLEDVWVIGAERLSALRREVRSILEKLERTPYAEQGRLMADAIERRLGAVEESQSEPFVNPAQHITRYREDAKQLERVEADFVSLRQLMVMAALKPDRTPEAAGVADTGAGPVGEQGGGLSARSTWQLILGILGMLAFVSISFFLIARRQLKVQLAKQAVQTATATEQPSTILGHAATPPPPPAP